jgi:hypothetical protein
MYNSQEIKELLDFKNYEEVKPSEVNPVKEKKESINLVDNNLEFWSKKGKTFLKSFEKGEIISNYRGVSEHDYLTFLLGISRLLEETFKEELLKRSCDVTEIKEVFQLINSSFKVLSFSIEKSLNSELNTDKDKPIDINIIFSIFHGYISSLVEKNLNQ